MMYMKIVLLIIAAIVGYSCKKEESIPQVYLPYKYQSNAHTMNVILLSLAGMMRLHKSGWIDMRKRDKNSLPIEIAATPSGVYCKGKPGYTKVKIIDITAMDVTDNSTTYSLQVDTDSNNLELKLLNGIVINVENRGEAENEHIKNLLKKDATAYIVCKGNDEKAVLMPNIKEEVEFKKPSWTTKVQLNVFKHPVVPFGRLFKVYILDSVEVLENNKREFILTFDTISLYDVYYLSHVIIDQNNRNFCNLTYTSDMHAPVLDCNYKKFSISKVPSLSYFFTGLFLLNAYYLYNIKTIQRDEHISYNSTNDDGSLDGLDKKYESSDLYKNPQFFKFMTNNELKNVAKVNLIYTLPYMFIKLLGSMKSMGQMVFNLRSVKKLFDNAKPYYQWTIMSVS